MGEEKAVPRYLPERAFPAYAFVPGLHPHPNTDPRGHSYGQEEPVAEYYPARQWQANEMYLYGVDLYNHGYLWESHVFWEALWHATKSRDELQTLYLQGLIQLSAAALKVPMKQALGLSKLSRMGTEKLAQVAESAPARYMGLALPPHIEGFRRFADAEPDSIASRPRMVLDFTPEGAGS